MLLACYLLLVLWGGVIAVWAALLIAQIRARRAGLFLDPNRTFGPDRPGIWQFPSVCVVIPVRNSARALERCVRSIQDQDFSQLHICIIDDRSDDDTHSAAEDLAALDSRVRVRRIESLAPGWLGKSHALWHGTRDASEEWLLFVDDDCVLDPPAVRTAVAEAMNRDVDLLSLWPRHLAGSFWEHMLIPLCSAIMALWYSSWRPGDPECSRPFANGQFLLVKRSSYERIDGHRAVRRALIEDIAVAEHARKAGLTTRVASGSKLFGVRMYRDYASIRDGWARIYAGTLRSGMRIAISLLWLLAGSLWPFLAALLLAAHLLESYSAGRPVSVPDVAATSLAVSHLILLFVVSYRFWGMGGCCRLYLWLYPLSVTIICRILMLAGWYLLVTKSVVWRGTRYLIDNRGRIDC